MPPLVPQVLQVGNAASGRGQCAFSTCINISSSNLATATAASRSANGNALTGGDINQFGDVLEGSVRKAGGLIRITAQLIEAATGTHLWANKIDGSLENVFELQDNVARSVVGGRAILVTKRQWVMKPVAGKGFEKPTPLKLGPLGTAGIDEPGANGAGTSFGLAAAQGRRLNDKMQNEKAATVMIWRKFTEPSQTVNCDVLSATCRLPVFRCAPRRPV